MNKKLTYPVRFNVRPGDYKRHKRFFKVLIFDSRVAMYAFYLEYAKLSKWEKRTGSHKNKFGIAPKMTYDSKPIFDAIVLMYSWRTKMGSISKTSGDIGVMLFFKDRLGAGLVSHEFGHAAFHHNRIKVNFKDLNLGKRNCVLEEACLYDLAAMVRKFTNKCYSLGVY